VERRGKEERAKEEERTKSVDKEKAEEAQRIFEEAKAKAVAEVTAQRVAAAAAAAAAATKDKPMSNINELLADLKQDDSMKEEDISLGSDDSIASLKLEGETLARRRRSKKTGQTRQHIRSLGRRGRLKRRQPRKWLKGGCGEGWEEA
jgi:hypothetical protein